MLLKKHWNRDPLSQVILSLRGGSPITRPGTPVPPTCPGAGCGPQVRGNNRRSNIWSGPQVRGEVSNRHWPPGEGRSPHSSVYGVHRRLRSRCLSSLLNGVHMPFHQHRHGSPRLDPCTTLPVTGQTRQRFQPIGFSPPSGTSRSSSP